MTIRGDFQLDFLDTHPFERKHLETLMKQMKERATLIGIPRITYWNMQCAPFMDEHPESIENE